MHIELRMAMIGRGYEISEVFIEHLLRYREAHRPAGARPEPVIVDPVKNEGDITTRVYVDFDRRTTSPMDESAIYYAMALSFVDPRILALGGNLVISFHSAVHNQALVA